MIFYRVKPANLECEWTIEDDSRLLRGIYIHGMGSWEAIKADASLKLNEKLQANGSKSQWKRISTRGEYLLKVVKKQIDQKLGVVRIFLQTLLSRVKLLVVYIILLYFRVV